MRPAMVGRPTIKLRGMKPTMKRFMVFSPYQLMVASQVFIKK